MIMTMTMIIWMIVSSNPAQSDGVNRQIVACSEALTQVNCIICTMWTRYLLGFISVETNRTVKIRNNMLILRAETVITVGPHVY